MTKMTSHECFLRASLRALLLFALALGMTAVPTRAQEEHAQEEIASRLFRSQVSATDPGEALDADPTGARTRLRRIISIHLDGVSLEEALRRIADAGDVKLFYPKLAVLSEKEVHMDLEHITVLDAVRAAIRSTKLHMQLSRSGHLVLFRAPEVKASPARPEPIGAVRSLRKLAPEEGAVFTLQTGTIAGTVTDSTTGEPTPGVNVVIAGTQRGAATDAEGHFTISGLEPGTYALLASFVGYDTKRMEGVTVTANDTTVVNIALQSTQVGLEEVVVVAFGQQEEADLTGSVDVVQAEDLAGREYLRTSAALQGMVPGLTVTRNSGAPGENGGTLRIRGIGTLGDSSPLVIIDGIEGSLDGLDPNNIESISVLKDAAAASIYGARAANGVILITTKRASHGAEMQVTYNTHVGWQQPTDLPNFLGGYQFMTLVNEAYENEGKAPVYSEEYISRWQELHDEQPNEYPSSDWQEAVLTESGFEQYHNLAVSGGTEKIWLRGTLGYMDQEGIIANTNYKSYRLRLNTNINVSDKLDLAFDLYGRRSRDIEPSMGMYDIFYDMNRNTPVSVIRYTDGSWGPGVDGQNSVAWIHDGGLDRDTWTEATARLHAVYEPFENASIDVTFAPQYNEASGRSFRRQTQIYDFEPGPESGELLYSYPAESYLNVSNSHTLETTLNILANYQTTIGRNFLKGLAGFQRITYRNDWSSAFRDGFPLPNLPQLNAGSVENMENEGSASEWALLSYFGRINYNYDDRYLFQVNLRYDGSSRFAEENRFGLFPSFSAGWRVSEEAFMQSVDFISNLKLRASWGRLGNQNIGLYPYLSTVNLGLGYAFGSAPVDGAAQTELANEDISWEATEMANAGLDLGLWEDQLELTFDYYVKNTYDILLRLPIPSSVGLTAPYQNAGQVRNVGWELSVSHRNALGDFTYGISFNLSDVRNEVVDLAGTGPYISGMTIIEEGFPINSIYGYEAAGLFQSEEEVEQHAEQFATTAPGDIRYVDQNGDDVINAADRVILGNRIPRYTFGLDLNAAYKGFDLAVSLQGVGKRAGYLQGAMAWAFWNGGKVQEWQLDRWTLDNRDASYPRFSILFPNNRENSGYWMRDASYLRLKTVQLGYTLPETMLDSLPLQGLRVYVNGQDLLSWDSYYSGLDPETPLGSGHYYPITAKFTVGMEMRF